MKLTYSALINDISGRSGGVVFTRWQGIRIGRVFTPPTQPRTSAQVGHRNLFRWLNRMYKLVSLDWQLESWKRAALGRPGIARNFFMANNLSAIGSETNDNSFVPFYIQTEPSSAWVGAAAAGTQGTITFTWTTAPSPSGAGRALSQVVVCAWGAAAPRQTAPSAILSANSGTGSGGSVAITGLAAGTYSVIAIAAFGDSEDATAQTSILSTPTTRLEATVT